MILILSDKEDYSTSDVIQWLNYYKETFIRINKEDTIELESLSINNKKNANVVLKCKGKRIPISEINAFWYRRGFLNFKELSLHKKSKSSLSKEVKIINNSIYNLLKNKERSIGNYINASVNKLDILQTASKVGLLIPDTIITSRKDVMLDFFYKHKRIITKPIYEAPSILSDIPELQYGFYTSEIDIEFIKQLPERFFMSLFQERLDKKYELRVFYLHGECYAMAIFSQNDTKTTTDFRHYNYKKPNRTIPYKLSKKIVRKIQKFMTEIVQNCGSLDLVVTKKEDIVFLEINPIGQFGMVSIPCNYKLEKKIAQYLSKNEN